MTDEQFQTLMEMLNEIKELLQQSQQPQTKITVVGNKVQSNTKGLKNIGGVLMTSCFRDSAEYSPAFCMSLINCSSGMDGL